MTFFFNARVCVCVCAPNICAPFLLCCCSCVDRSNTVGEVRLAAASPRQHGVLVCVFMCVLCRCCMSCCTLTYSTSKNVRKTTRAIQQLHRKKGALEKRKRLRVLAYVCEFFFFRRSASRDSLRRAHKEVEKKKSKKRKEKSGAVKRGTKR